MTLTRPEIRRTLLENDARNLHGRRLRFGGDPSNPKRSAVVRTHHEEDQYLSVFLDGMERSGRMQHVWDYDCSYSVVCDCVGSEGKILPEECEGLGIFNAAGNQVASYRGRWYRAAATTRNTLTVYSCRPTHIDRRFF
jgi:hypothetical protein